MWCLPGCTVFHFPAVFRLSFKLAAATCTSYAKHIVFYVILRTCVRKCTHALPVRRERVLRCLGIWATNSFDERLGKALAPDSDAPLEILVSTACGRTAIQAGAVFGDLGRKQCSTRALGRRLPRTRMRSADTCIIV